MAAFDFPSSPVVGQVFTQNGVTYRWDGQAWMGGPIADTGVFQPKDVNLTAIAAIADNAPGYPLFDGAGGCRYCHVEKQRMRPAGTIPEYKRTAVPLRWFPRAQFDHAKHSMLQCGDCHPAATSRQTSDVLLPTIGQCAKCHQKGAATGTARADCLECHRYHAPLTERE